jgi:hypothetical protein
VPSGPPATNSASDTGTTNDRYKSAEALTGRERSSVSAPNFTSGWRAKLWPMATARRKIVWSSVYTPNSTGGNVRMTNTMSPTP